MPSTEVMLSITKGYQLLGGMFVEEELTDLEGEGSHSIRTGFWSDTGDQSILGIDISSTKVRKI